MMKPEDGIKGRCLEGAHMTTSANLIMDFIVDVLKTSKAAVVARSAPLIVGESIKVGV